MLRFGDCNGITTTNTVPNRHNFFTAKLFLFSFFKTVIFNGRYFFRIHLPRSSADRNNKKGKDFDLKMAKKTQKNHKFAYETFALIFIFSPISPVCATPLRYASFVRHYLHFFFFLASTIFFISDVVYLILCFVCYLLVYIRPTKLRWSRAPLLKSET